MGSFNDPIADLITRIRNAGKARRRYVDVSWSKIKENIVKVLKEEGFVAYYLVKEEKKKGVMRIFLKYISRNPIIQGLRRFSKSSVRRYFSWNAIPSIMGGMGITILSTPKGVLEGSKARAQKVGGELLCIVW